MLKIAVNRHFIRSNLVHGTNLPPITIYRGGRPIDRGHWVSIPGQSYMLYCPDDPLKCGARVWLECDNAEVIS
jgi:hypothetical protein